MDLQKLTKTVQELFDNGKGILAMDESTQNCNKRFAKLGIKETEESRRAWRELIITTPNLAECIGGLILYDETIRQKTALAHNASSARNALRSDADGHNDAGGDGVPFIKVITDVGIILGIKVDEGLKDMDGHPNEKVTKGLDGLAGRLKEYYDMGARFAKWRAAFTICSNIPTQDCINENAKILAEYALVCQEAGIVPIVEPEVLMDGSHTIEKCQQVTKEVLQTVFKELTVKGVVFEGMILKPNMVVPGLACPAQNSVDEVADATVKLLIEVVPANVAGVAFLSGGQSSELASAHLSAMNANYKKRLPWPVTFSYSRAIQYPALEIWQGNDKNIVAAQKSLYHRAKLNQAACRGEYNIEMEK